ncbi:arginine--tRNA ligase [Derxia gummosa]|uniref:Arginine--tRNA ligase n=1 Tax=Derxia gummosa DSM 723 TaxID=1121388 RepID=A0A8B6X5S8_9BURK|nr:arginine--tRNA ligase [Derxia gummosa]
MLPELRTALIAAIGRAVQVAAPGATPNIALERPKAVAHGDIATNVALQIAKPLRKNPRELAENIVKALQEDAEGAALIESAELAGPGFVNLRLRASAKQQVVRQVLEQGARFGLAPSARGAEGADAGPGKVIVEFVSANPTGPLHVGHGRQAALGDAICNLLATQGWKVHREFYYNDAGVQIGNLAISVQARAKGFKPGDEGWPAAAYNGDYIADIATDFLAGKTVHADDREFTGSGNADDLDSIRQFAVAYLRHEQDLDLQAFGVRFDNYYLESSLYTDGKVKAAVDALVASGKTYESEGALWLRTTDFADLGQLAGSKVKDDKDRVMRKSDGTYTYFVPDVAYHVTKWERGFTKAVNIQGSDHHGTIARVRAGLQALDIGIANGFPDYVLHKMVTVMKGGEEVKISKRAGSYVTVRDLIDWTGRDAVRFFLASRKADTEFIFDVDLAVKQTDENPVFYVQYAHARICSVLNAGGIADDVLAAADLAPLAGEGNEKALALMQRLAEYPDTLAVAANDFAPHLVAFYLRELAADFHSFYNAERVLVDDAALKTARLALLLATRTVLRNALALLGVSAPDKM